MRSATQEQGGAEEDVPVDGEAMTRRLFLQRLIRNDVTVRTLDSGVRHVVAQAPDGEPVVVPPGPLDAAQVRGLLDAVGVDVAAFQEMR